MVKKMLINATHPEEYRVAIVEDGILAEFDIEVAGHESTRGNIYKGVVVRVESGLQAAFVDFGAERMGFLQMGEIHPSYFRAWREKTGDKGGRPRITDLFHRGQEILVQIVKEERGTKGAALTTYLSLAGRFMVFLPDSDTRGVSRKIEEEGTRKKIKQTMNSLELPAQTGYIIRTAAIGQKKEELKRDFNYLQSLFQNIQTLAGQVKAPALVYRESNLIIRSIRDYFTPDMDEVLVDDPRVFDEARTFFQEVMPEFARLVKLHQERRPIFNRYQIEEQIETISKNRVPLPSGGSIVIDATEALVAVDVNSGKLATEQGVEGTATRTNLEAAEEVARQLRLRDLGGLVVIDFIDMRERKNIRTVEKCLRDALKRDKARTTVGRISQFGLLEMSRQRIKSVLAEATFRFCPTCNGSGKIKSPEAQAVAFLRRLHGGVAKDQIARAEGEVPLDVATYLLNTKREELLDLEKRHQVTIHIKGRHDLGAGQAELHLHRRETEIPPVDAGTAEPVSAEGRPEAPAPEEPEKERTAGEESAPESEPKGRKRSRRRHRGKRRVGTEQGGENPGLPPSGSAENGGQTGETPPDQAAFSVPGPTPETSPAPPVEAPPLEPSEEKAAEAAAPGKPKRRRSRRKHRPAETEKTQPALKTEGSEPTPEPQEATVSSPVPADAASPGHQAPEAVAKPAEEGEEKSAQKKPRPRRSKPKPPAEGAAQAETRLIGSQVPTPEPPSQKEPAESKPASRPSRPRKKPAAPAGPKPGSAEATASQSLPATPQESASGGMGKPAPPPATSGEAPPSKPAPPRRRRPAAKKKPEQAPATDSPSGE